MHYIYLLFFLNLEKMLSDIFIYITCTIPTKKTALFIVTGQ